MLQSAESIALPATSLSDVVATFAPCLTAGSLLCGDVKPNRASEGQPSEEGKVREVTSANQKTTHADAVITVHAYEPAAYDEAVGGLALSRIHVEESFSGDISGEGVVEFLQAARADGSASFVGIERVTGTVAGRRGTFLLQDAGTVLDDIVSGDWFVIPGSGTGELSGLRGTGGFRANLGEGAQVHLEYWFE